MPNPKKIAMDAKEYIHICKIGLDQFSDDGPSLLGYLRRHKENLVWATVFLGGASHVASADLLELIEATNQQQSSLEFLKAAKGDLRAIVADLLSGLQTYTLDVPTKRRWVQGITVVFGLAISLTVLLLGNGLLVQFGVLTFPRTSSGNTPSSGSSGHLEIANLALVILHILQLLVISIILYRQTGRFDAAVQRIQTKKDIGRIGQETLLQFRSSWLLLWRLWIVLYSWLSLMALAGWKSTPLTLSITDGLDLVNGFAIWKCFFALDLPSVDLPADPANASPANRAQPYHTAILVATVAGLVCLGLSVSDRVWSLHNFGVALIGLYSGLALASFTGRLSSHHIGIPRWMPLCLYLYSMIQVFYSFFDFLHAEWRIAVYFTALVLKVTLAFAGIDMLRYGGLDRYLKAADIGLLVPVHEAAKLRAEYQQKLKEFEAGVGN